MEKIQKESFDLSLGNGLYSAMHRFYSADGGDPILLIHGSIENSRIFYSRSGKGLAPFLAAQGFDVFVPDLAGKGKSKPRISRGFDHDQHRFISHDIDAYMSHIAGIYPGRAIRLGAHSWGGVLLLAWMARYNTSYALGPAVFFGSKRRIGVMGFKRLFMVDIMWTLVGSAATLLKGYLPAKQMGMGSDNEPAAFYRQVNKWVYSRRWRDGIDGFDYHLALAQTTLPPILYFAGKDDHVLGHPRDVQSLMNETKADNGRYVLLAKTRGHARNYGHIDMLTHGHCPSDHFTEAVKWWRQAKTKNDAVTNPGVSSSGNESL